MSVCAGVLSFRRMVKKEDLLKVFFIYLCLCVQVCCLLLKVFFIYLCLCVQVRCLSGGW